MYIEKLKRKDAQTDETSLALDLKELSEDKDYHYLHYRALSNTIVNPHSFSALSFPSDVLKKAVKLFLGKPVQSDHSFSVKDTLGTVHSAVFVNEKDGVPAGIDVVLKVMKGNEEFDKRIEMKALTSVSVSVLIDWQPSANIEPEKFWDFVGMKGNDGKQVTRIATEIKDSYEISFVLAGADPFAKQYTDGKLATAGYVAEFSKLKENQTTLNNKVALLTKENETAKAELQIATDALADAKRMLSENASEVVKLKESVSLITKERDNLQGLVDKDTAKLRNRVNALYSTAVKGETDKAMIALFENADRNTLNSFELQYKKIIGKFTKPLSENTFDEEVDVVKSSPSLNELKEKYSK